ncbi:MAG: hypothetical protein IT299_10660 [Dehalococcoidia bacterium]|nr:hypothetical protein [Dehalococcoidia bacterium]
MIRAARYRLMGYTVAVIAVVLVATGALVYGLLTRQLDEAVDDRLRAIGLGPPPFGAGGAERLPPDTFVIRSLGPRGTVASEETPEGFPNDAALASARANGSDLRTVEVDGERYRVLTEAISVGRGGTPKSASRNGSNGTAEGSEEQTSRPGGSENGSSGNNGGGSSNGGGSNGGNGGTGGGFELTAYQQVGMSLEERERQQWVIRLALAGGGGLGIALTGLGAFFLTGQALEPVAASMARQRRFVSDASHELRTPLALLRLELERDTGLAAERRRPLLREVDRLGRMVDDLLVLARLDEHAMPLDKEPVPVADLLRTAADEARRLAPESRVTIEEGPSPWIDGDADRLHQVLLVLVDNAARVTPPGEAITLRAGLDGKLVTMSVTDGGPGVSEEHAAPIFERFYRVDKARARAQGGAGLGLSIARDMVRAHGGELRLANPGQPHATFEIRLPALDLATSEALEPEPETA